MACAAANCRNKCEKGAYRGFKFPLDKDLCSKWVTNCRRENWTPTSDSVLCQVHFETSQFTRSDQGIDILKENAVPTIFESSRTSAEIKASPAEYVETIPSAVVETILQSSSDSESTEDATANPSKSPAVEHEKVQVHPNHESDTTKSEYYGRNRICYVCKKSGGGDVRFFSFPSNPKMLSLWASACNIDPDRVFPGDYLCSRHFRPEDIPNKNSERKRCSLKRTVVPIPIKEVVVLDQDYSDSYLPDDPLNDCNQEDESSPQLDSSKPILTATRVDCESNNNSNITILDSNISQLDSPKPILTAIQVDCESNNNSNITRLDSIENVPCDVSANDVLSVPENIPEPKFTLWKRRRYVGEFEEEDMDNSRIAKLFYAIAMQDITKKRRMIHKLQREVRYLRKKLPCKRRPCEDLGGRKKLPHRGNLSEDSDPDYEVITVTSPYH